MSHWNIFDAVFSGEMPQKQILKMRIKVAVDPLQMHILISALLVFPTIFTSNLAEGFSAGIRYTLYLPATALLMYKSTAWMIFVRKAKVGKTEYEKHLANLLVITKCVCV